MNVANQLIGISSAAEAQIVHVAEEQSKSAEQHTTDQLPLHCDRHNAGGLAVVT